MRLRLIALIGLVLGLSRLAFPATAQVKQRVAKARTALKHRATKTRPRPVRRAPAPPKRHVVTPLIEAPDLRLSEAAPIVDLPVEIRELTPHSIAASAPPAAPRLRNRARSLPSGAKPLRHSYWTAERAVADVVYAREARFASAPGRMIAIGDPHLAYAQQQSTILRYSIRI